MSANLRGPEKAALLILGIDEDIAKSILRHMDENALGQLARTIEAMDPVPIDSLDATFTEFIKAMGEPVLPGGSRDYLHKLAVSALGEDRANRLFEGPVTRPIDNIRQARAATVARFLEEEHPQVAAVIISQLGRAHGATILEQMPEDRQADVMSRIARLDEISPHAVDQASGALSAALEAAGALDSDENNKSFDGLALAASILNELDPTKTDQLMSVLEDDDAELAPKIREAMFTFEDLSQIDKRGLQALMREVPSDKLLIALKTASDSLRDALLGAISQRAAQTLREDLELMPPTRISDVENAQKEISEIALRLAAENTLVLPGGGGEEMV